MSGEVDPVTLILRRDPRYARAAYDFVREALREAIARREGGEGHVSARELLGAVRDAAREEFGPLARAVLDDWGVRTTADWGAVVFNLIDVDVFGRTDEDALADFEDVYDFASEFPTDTGEVRVHVQHEDDDLELEEPEGS